MHLLRPLLSSSNQLHASVLSCSFVSPGQIIKIIIPGIETLTYLQLRHNMFSCCKTFYITFSYTLYTGPLWIPAFKLNGLLLYLKRRTRKSFNQKSGSFSLNLFYKLLQYCQTKWSSWPNLSHLLLLL